MPMRTTKHETISVLIRTSFKAYGYVINEKNCYVFLMKLFRTKYSVEAIPKFLGTIGTLFGQTLYSKIEYTRERIYESMA